MNDTAMGSGPTDAHVVAPATLAERAGASILSLLDARDCVWRRDGKGTASPMLRPDGTLTAVTDGDRGPST